MPQSHLCGASAASARSCPQQGTHQAHRRVHLVVVVQGFPQQLVQSRPARHRQVLGLPHALGKVAVDVGLGEHQVFAENLGEAMAEVGLSRGAQPWGTQGVLLPVPLPSSCRGAQPGSPAPPGWGIPSFSSTTYIKELLAGVRQHLPEAFLIPFIDELVSVHPLSFVEPETHQVHGTFQAFGGGEQQTLTNTRIPQPSGVILLLLRAEFKGWLWEEVMALFRDMVHCKDA